ncbi:MAG: HEPN domain-containing protein [Chitinophagaceae bacterium]
MKVIFFCSISNMGPIEKDLELVRFNLSSDRSKIDEVLKNEGIQKSIGRVERSQFESLPFFYGEMDLNTKLDNEISEQEIKTVQDNITIYYGVLERYISFLWFSKDNCCSLNSLYAYLPAVKKMLIRRPTPLTSTSKGESDVETTFTTDALMSVGSLLTKSSEFFYHKNYKQKTLKDPPQEDLQVREILPYDFKKQTRIERAFHFLDLARRSNQLVLKISFYVCVYETLFYGTTTGEISHQIAERAALFFSNTRIFRHSVYKQLKQAYAVRSTYFHGNSFKGYKKDLTEISFYLDNLTRDILYRVFSKDSKIFLQSDTLLELSFLDMLFEDERRPDGITFESGVGHIRFRG